MFRWLGKILGLTAFIAAGSVGIWIYHDRYSDQRKIDRLEDEKRVLTRVVERLSDEKRVAEVLVTEQSTVNGALHTTLLFVEQDKTGTFLTPRSYDVQGENVHIDALVIKFERDFVKEGDGLRGHSLALFTRIFGDLQTPEKGELIDAPAKIPDLYRDADPRVSEFEQGLWRDFWRLLDDAEYRGQKGVRIANGQGLWWPPKPDKLYTITLESDGGLNMTSKPLEGIYREALKRRAVPSY